MRNTLCLLPIVALAGCATTSEGLGRSKVEDTFTSSKSTVEVATCMVERLRWGPVLRNNGDHYWIVRLNGYNAPIVRFDFKPNAEGGTLVELRAANIAIGSGKGTLRTCL